MAFGQELRDFVSGYSKGEDILSSRSRRKLTDIEAENKRPFTEAEIAARSNPLGGGSGQAIPETTGGGGKGMRGDELAWKGASPEQRGLLNAIAGPESGGRYNVAYGGKTFGSYADHPRIDTHIQTGPNAGRTSSAAGKYQFLGSTWDTIAKKYNLPDFSPENQDKAAWYLAAETYGGEDKLNAALKSGDPKVLAGVGSALRGQWTSLPGGIEQGQNTNTFVNNFTKYRDAAPQTAAAQPAAAAPAAAAAAAPAKPAEPQKQAMLAPDEGQVAIPENPYAVASAQPALVAPEEEWGQKPLFAQSGGIIPEPVQRFQDGGVPVGNPSGTPDRYNRFRDYTQQIPQSAAPMPAARRISFPTTTPTAAQPLQRVDGMTPSQLAVKQANDKLAADRAAAAAAKPVAAAPAAAPVRRADPSQMIYAPGGGGSGQQQWFQVPPPTSKFPNRKATAQPAQPQATQFARGGAIPDRDKQFQELLRQETRQRPTSVGDHEGGESARDRAARRLSAQEKRPSSTAYSEHSEYWQKPGKKEGGGKKAAPSKEKTAAIAAPNTTLGGTPLAPSPVGPGGTPLAPSPVGPGGTPTAGYDASNATLGGTPLAPSPVGPGGTPTAGYTAIPETGGPPQAGGTPTAGYEPAHPGVGTSKVPAVPRVYRPAPPAAPVTGKPGGPAQPRPTIGTTKVAPTAEAARRPGPPQPQGPPAPPPSGVDPARRAADVADTRRRMELVTTPPTAPPANALVAPAALPEEDQGQYPDVPPQDWSQVQDQRPAIARNLLSPLLNEQGKRLFGYAAGGMIPEPGEPGYNEAVAGGATATPSAETTASIPPQQERMQPTPKLMSDVSKALDGGVRFLTRHFGLQQDGAVPTPEGGQTTQDGQRRFAQGEGAATPQEIQQIDDHIDPDRQMSEGDRQMTRTAKIVQWYLERGRKDDAGAAAAGLMQYGAQRFSQIGSIAAAAYRNGDLDGTVKALQSAYSMIPDGGAMDVQVDPKTQQLVVSHTDDQGKTTNIPVKPEDLQGIIQGVQNKSMYWQQIMTLADPEGQHLRERTAASTGEWNRQHGIERGEKLTDAEAAAKAEAAKNEREKGETIATEERAAKRAATEAEAKSKAELEKEGRTNVEEERRTLRNAAIARAQKLAETKSDVNWDAVNPLMGDAADAMASKDQTQIDTSLSKLWDALPTKDRAKTFGELGYDPASFKHVATTATPMAAVGDAPPAEYPNAKKGTDKQGKPIWVVEKDGKRFAVPAS